MFEFNFPGNYWATWISAPVFLSSRIFCDFYNYCFFVELAFQLFRDSDTVMLAILNASHSSLVFVSCMFVPLSVVSQWFPPSHRRKPAAFPQPLLLCCSELLPCSLTPPTILFIPAWHFLILGLILSCAVLTTCAFISLNSVNILPTVL